MYSMFSFADYCSEQGTVISATSEVEGLSAANVATPIIGEPWRATCRPADDFTVYITFTNFRSIDVICVVFPRNSASTPPIGSIEITSLVESDGYTQLAFESLNVDRRHGYYLYKLQERKSVASLALRFFASAENFEINYIDVGRIWCGPAFFPDRDFEYGWTRQWEDSGTNIYAPKSGARFSDSGIKRRVASVSFPAINGSDAEEMFNADYDVGSTGQMLFCSDYRSPSRNTIIGTMELSSMSKVSFPASQKTYTIKEDV